MSDYVAYIIPFYWVVILTVHLVIFSVTTRPWREHWLRVVPPERVPVKMRRGVCWFVIYVGSIFGDLTLFWAVMFCAAFVWSSDMARKEMVSS